MKTRFLFIFFLSLTLLPIMVFVLQIAVENKVPSFLFADELPETTISKEITDEIEKEIQKETQIKVEKEEQKDEKITEDESDQLPSENSEKIKDEENKKNVEKKQEEVTAKNDDDSDDKQSSKIKYSTTNNRKSPIGINANEIFEQDSSIPFIDLMRVATPFHENIRCRAQDQPCITSTKVEYDKQGWPKMLNGGTAGVFFLRNVQLAALPSGEFTVLYDGEGKLELS